MATTAQAIKLNDGKIIDFPLQDTRDHEVPDDELHEGLANPSTAKTKRLKKRLRFKHTAAGEFVDPNIKAGIERMRLITESHKESVGRPQVVRRALGLEHILNKCTLVLQEDELIVGFNAEHPEKVPLYPETSWTTVADFINSPYSPEEQIEAVEIMNYWIPNSIQSIGERYFTPDELRRFYAFSNIEPPAFANAYNSVVPPYEVVLQDGLAKRIAMAEKHINKAMEEMAAPDWNGPERLPFLHKIDNWDAMIIADKAVIAWARRHGRLCKIVAENFETDPKRKEELLMMADICHRIPAEPCKGFRDAMQAKWFTFLVAHAMETYASGYAHKEDSLMFPFYQMSVVDKSFQPMTHGDVVELFECERLKVSEHGCGKNRLYRQIFPGSNDLFILSIGGVNSDGTDGSNECTNAILEAARNIRTAEPSIVYRWNGIGNEKTKELVFGCIRDGLGYPSIKNDEVGIEQLKGFGATEEEARDWCLVLCMSPGHFGREKTQKMRTEGGGATIAIKTFELALSDGFDWSFSQGQQGPHTGDPRDFKTYEEFREAVKLQYEYSHDMLMRGKDVSRQLQIEYIQLPFVSSIDDGCMEQGEDATSLCELPNPWIQIVTGIVAANSMAAIKKLIYEEKKYTMNELIDALHANWDGYEKMRQDFYNAPKWGNDDDYADEVVKDLFENILTEHVKRMTTYSGGAPMIGTQGVAAYLHGGAVSGPTPDGRFGGEAADDGGISPMAGTDKKGPTAVLKSISKLDHTKFKFNLLNQRLSVPMMRSVHGFDLWHAYMKTWHDLKIDHVQFNVVSNDELKAAQKEPEKHGDLIVRVSGFSARFIDLSTYGQNTILARTDQTFAPNDFDGLNVQIGASDA